ncbi:hypothetical protein [Nonomuraea dietziae]|uniref:hypothetical protein n=1 Tax=Nonomuraea dietziae TaxID=65515 RepID=UPI0033D5BA67
MTTLAIESTGIAATLTGNAVQLAADLLADRGWWYAAIATQNELLDLIDEAIATGDIHLCEVCQVKVTDQPTTYASGEEIAICEDCGGR